MSYLTNHFLGKYRILAHYDPDTNDFYRLSDGTLDPSFNDYYIPCTYNCEIRHAYQNNLSAYIPSIGRGHNILKEVYTNNIDKDLTKFEKIMKKTKVFDYDKFYEALEKNGIVYNIDETDIEVTFQFKTKDVDKIAKIMKPNTKGANIRPLSTQNLPKTNYEIPEEDLKKYDIAIMKAPKKWIKPPKMDEEIEIIDGLIISQLTKKFYKVIKRHDVSKEMKLAGMKNDSKGFIHSIGLWDEFCDFMKKEIDKMNE